MNSYILNLSAYTSPIISESKKGEYVEYGADNNYFQFLIDRYLYSTTNNAIITGCSNMIYGKGIGALDGNKKPDEYAKFMSLIKPNALRKVALERKLLGMAAMQIGYDKGQVSFIEHFPMHTLRAEKCNDKGDIEAWYYHPDWTKKKQGEEVKRIPAFGFGNKKDVEIFVVKPYISGYHYYTPIDYSGALPYAKLEEEISDYLINDVQNSFSGTKIINFNNGVPPEEKREEISNDVKRKVTGSRGQKTIVSFSNSKETATEVIDIPLNDAPAHYEYLSKECFEKLVIGHRVTSPMLLGVRETGGGFSNNADEIKTATLLYDNLVIKPYQLEIIEALDEILAVNNIKLKLYFKTIQPLEFTDLENAQTADQVAEETGIELSKQVNVNALVELGEDEDMGGWVLVDERDVDYNLEDELDEQLKNYKPKENLFQKFAKAVKAIPNAKSEQDKVINDIQWKVRYKYAGNPNPERDFCKTMMNAKKIYRKEDLVNVNSNIVNDGFGHNGEPYNVFLFKGGPRCRHSFKRLTFAAFEGQKVDVTDPNQKQIGTRKAEIMGYKITNPYQVSIQPKNLPNKGFHPNNKNLPIDAQ